MGVPLFDISKLITYQKKKKSVYGAPLVKGECGLASGSNGK